MNGKTKAYLKKIYSLIPRPLASRLKARIKKQKPLYTRQSPFFQEHSVAIEKKYGLPNGSFEIKIISLELRNDLVQFLESTKSIIDLSPLKNNEVDEFNIDKFDIASRVDSGSSLLHGIQDAALLNRVFNKTILNAWTLDPENTVVKKLHAELRFLFSDFINSPFAIVNTRAWSSASNSEEFGMYSMHTDGFEPGHLKIMIYPDGLNKKNGALQIGDKLINDLKPGSCVGFTNNEVEHRAIPGTNQERLSIEVTVQRTFVDIDQYNKSHWYGRHLAHPKYAYLYQETKSTVLPKRETRFINIGSGKRNWSNWLLLDELLNTEQVNGSDPYIYPYVSSPFSTIPAYKDSADIIYSSHHIEHISDESLKRLFSEAHRVLRKDGYLLLKYPNYDWAFKQYYDGNKNFLDGLGIETIAKTWHKRDIIDCIENRLAFLVCGYWNIEYGNHFSGPINFSGDAFHGPPYVELLELKQMFCELTINEIARSLRRLAVKDPTFKAFNHQSAWSFDELSGIAKAHKFRKISSSREYIRNLVGYSIPDFHEMDYWSAYQLFCID